jgi:hypothetical protein
MAVGGTAHRRTPDMIANLAIGLERCLQFAVDLDSAAVREEQ